MSSGEDRPSEGPGRRPLLVAAGTALVLMMLVVVTTAKSSPILTAPNRDPNLNIRHATLKPPTPAGASQSGSSLIHSASGRQGYAVVGIILDIFLVALLLVVLWLLAGAAVAAYRRWHHERRLRISGPLPEVDDAVLDSVAQATTRQQQLLHQGTPSNAIVACWVDLEHAAAAAGVERRPSETSAELTIRVLDNLDVDRRALRDLGRLYRAARYSSHPLTENDRETARTALERLSASLAARAADV